MFARKRKSRTEATVFTEGSKERRIGGWACRRLGGLGSYARGDSKTEGMYLARQHSERTITTEYQPARARRMEAALRKLVLYEFQLAVKGNAASSGTSARSQV
jgi:hypothetical protein